MQVTIAENAGFCFGVKRATDRLETAIAGKKREERIYTLGTLIHNEIYNQWLKDNGVEVIEIEAIGELFQSATAASPVTVFVRAHGIPLQDEMLLRRCAEENRYFRYNRYSEAFSASSLSCLPSASSSGSAYFFFISFWNFCM